MITGTMKLQEILAQYPESFDVFRANGFDYPDPPQLLAAAGADTMLQTLIKVRGMNQELFIYYLDQAILQKEANRQYLLDDFAPDEVLDFYGNTICPLKFTFRDALEELEKEYQQQHPARKCYLEFGKMVTDTCEEQWDNPDPHSLPGIIFTKEFNGYLGFDFQQRMGHLFDGDFYQTTNPLLQQAGLVDPLRQYAVYAAMAEVFLIDQKRLGTLPVPRTLKDLLDPIYRDQIIIFGKDQQTLSNALFLYLYKQFGDEGIIQFAHNVKHALHGSVMSKTAGSQRPEGGAIYLVSWFFAQTCVRDQVDIIWPDDGAITLPMYMLVRNDAADRLKDITDYIVGDTFAKACVKAYTPPMNGNVESNLPPEAKLQWLGWDFIRQHDIPSLSDHCLDLFLTKWQQLHPEGRLCL